MFGKCAQKGRKTLTTDLAQPSVRGWQATAGIRNCARAEATWPPAPCAVARQARFIPRGTPAMNVATVVVVPAGTLTLATTVPVPCVTTSKRYCAWLRSKPRAFCTVKDGVSVVTCAPLMGLSGTGSGPRLADPGSVGPPPLEPQQAARPAASSRNTLRIEGEATRKRLMLQ